MKRGPGAVCPFEGEVPPSADMEERAEEAAVQNDLVEQLSMELQGFLTWHPDEMEDIAKDFYNCCVTEKVITEGGKDYAKEVLEKAFGQQQARNLMDRVSKALKTKAFSFIRKVDYKTLMTAIQNEHPQTLALILSYATPEQAFKIIANLPQETRVDVVERIACHGQGLCRWPSRLRKRCWRRRSVPRPRKRPWKWADSIISPIL